MPDVDNRFTRPSFYSDAPAASSTRAKSLTEQAIEEALRQGLEQKKTTPPVEDQGKVFPPLPNEGLSTLSKALMWGGMAADVGSSVYKLNQSDRFRETNPAGFLGMLALKAGLTPLRHYLLNRYAKRGAKQKSRADLSAKIGGGVEFGFAAHNLALKAPEDQ